MSEPRRRWRTLLAIGAGMATAGSLYYLYRRWRDEIEREEQARIMRNAAGLGEYLHGVDSHRTPIKARAAGQIESNQTREQPAMVPATPVSEVCIATLGGIPPSFYRLYEFVLLCIAVY
jgi:hypothetical protein